MKKTQLPRYRRLDLINSLPPGEQQRIARHLGISKAYVSQILNGRSNQNNDKGINVIRLAERSAAYELGIHALQQNKLIRR